MITFENVCLLLNIRIDAKIIVDPDQSDLDLHCLLKSLQNVSVDNKNIRLFVMSSLRVNLRVNTCEVSDIRSGLS